MHRIHIQVQHQWACGSRRTTPRTVGILMSQPHQNLSWGTVSSFDPKNIAVVRNLLESLGTSKTLKTFESRQGTLDQPGENHSYQAILHGSDKISRYQKRPLIQIQGLFIRWAIVLHNRQLHGRSKQAGLQATPCNIYIYIYIMNNTILRYELMSLNRLYGGVLHHYIIYAMMCVSVSNIPYKATVFE